jgi:hypothetical protein
VSEGRIYVATTGPSPGPDPAALGRDLQRAGLGNLDVQLSLVATDYAPVPRERRGSRGDRGSPT